MAQKDQLLQAAGTTTGAGSAFDLGGEQTNWTVYVIGTGTITSGSLQVETAYSTTYSGTWAPLGTALTLTTISANKQAIIQGNGPIRAIRANLAVNVGGGGSIEAHVCATS